MAKVSEELEKYKNGEINTNELYEKVCWCTELIEKEIVD